MLYITFTTILIFIPGALKQLLRPLTYRIAVRIPTLSYSDIAILMLCRFRLALLQARFNLRLPVPWSTCSSETLERCLLATATSGNIELFVYLTQLLLDAGKNIQVHAAADAAARSDQVEILRELQSTFVAEFHALPLGSLTEEAVKASSANAVQFLLELGPRFDLEYPYELALCYCNLDVLRQLKKHSPHIKGTYLPNGKLQIELILAKSFASWANKSKMIEFLVEHASADIDATGKDGLTVVHIAAVDNHIDALKLFENLGANMNCLGEVGQTPAEIALCNGHHIPFIGCSSLPTQLFSTKRNLAKTIIGKLRSMPVVHQSNNPSTRKTHSLEAFMVAERQQIDSWRPIFGTVTANNTRISQIHAPKSTLTIEDLHRRFHNKPSPFQLEKRKETNVRIHRTVIV